METNDLPKVPKLFLKDLEERAVHVYTRKQYDTLMQICEAGDWKWNGNYLPTELDIWKDYKQETCIISEKGVLYSSKVNYEMEKGEVLSFQGFCDFQVLEFKIVNENKNWFEKNKPNRKSRG